MNWTQSEGSRASLGVPRALPVDSQANRRTDAPDYRSAESNSEGVETGLRKSNGVFRGVEALPTVIDYAPFR